MEQREWYETIYGVRCRCRKTGRCTEYTFAVPGWAEVTVTGRQSAKRTIGGRLNPAVVNTMGSEWCATH